MVMAVAADLRETGAALPLPVEFLFGAAFQHGAGAIGFQAVMRAVQAFAQMTDAFLRFLEGFDMDLPDDISLRRKMQLSLWLRLSCDLALKLGFGGYTAGRCFKLFMFGHRS